MASPSNAKPQYPYPPSADLPTDQQIRDAHAELLCRFFESTSMVERNELGAAIDDLVAAHPWLRPDANT